MPVILLLLDALRYDYLSKDAMPFLNSLIPESEYYEHVIPSYGFCERTEILSGMAPDESGFFTAIGFEPEYSPYSANSIYSKVDRILGFLPEQAKFPGIGRNVNISRKARSYLAPLLLKRINSNRLGSYNIPFSFLPFLNLTEDAEESSYNNSSETESIIFRLNKEGRSVCLDTFTSLSDTRGLSDENRLMLAVNVLKAGGNDLILVYNSIPDHFGHKYGPDSYLLKNELKILDDTLKEFVAECQNINDDTTFVFLGDHGMAKVSQRLNIKSIIKKMSKRTRLKPVRDYVYFLDSTMFRMWFFSKESESFLMAELESDQELISHGRFVTKDYAEKFRIPYGDKRYGDLLWLANDGVLVSPDFFHSQNENIQGMHGYNPKNSENHGTCLVYGKKAKKQIIKEIELTDVYNILELVLGINE